MPPMATKRSKKLKFFELDSGDEVLQLTHGGLTHYGLWVSN